MPARHLAVDQPTAVGREPAVVIGTIGAFVAAVLALLAAFGLDVTEQQRDAILGMIAPTVLLILLISFLIRQRVRPESTVLAAVAPSGQVVAGGAAAQTTGSAVPAGATVAELAYDDARP